MEKNKKTLIEIPKESKELCINSFRENILNNYNFENLCKLSSTGQLGQKHLRGMVWKIFFGVLPYNESIEKWKEKLIYLRTKYKILSDKITKQQNYFDEEDKKQSAYNNDVKTSILKNNSIIFNPFRPEKETRNLINLDLKRTFQELALFKDKNIKNKIHHILFLWSVENPDYGYQQGMNDIVSIIFLALYPYYFENNLRGNNIKVDTAEELYLFFNDENELFSDLYICFNEVMKKGFTQFYENLFDSKKEQDEYIKKICLFPEEIKDIKDINEDISVPLLIRCSLIIKEKLKILDYDLYSYFDKIGLNCTIFLQRWLKCAFNREFKLNDVLIIWDAIFSSKGIKEEYELFKMDLIALSMILRLRNFLFLCDQSQCFMIFLQPQNIDNILELIIFSDKLNDAINDILSGKRSIFLENITNFSLNTNIKGNNQILNKNSGNEFNDNQSHISPIKNYEEGIERLGKIFNKYNSLMDINDQKEFINIIYFFNNYK